MYKRQIYEGSEATEFPECKKIPLSEREKQRCGDIGDWSKAQKFLQAGHSYLDRDNDGEACEALGRKSNRPENGKITIKDCYDGDTCTSSEGEKIRLACIDTPEIKGKRAKPNEAIAAKNFLNEMIKGEKVSIRRVTEDKYGRTAVLPYLSSVTLRIDTFSPLIISFKKFLAAIASFGFALFPFISGVSIQASLIFSPSLEVQVSPS